MKLLANFILDVLTVNVSCIVSIVSAVRHLLWHFKQQRRQIRAYKKSTFIKQPFDFGRNNMCKKVPQVYIIYDVEVKPYKVVFAWKTCFVYVCNTTEVFCYLETDIIIPSLLFIDCRASLQQHSYLKALDSKLSILVNIKR